MRTDHYLSNVGLFEGQSVRNICGLRHTNRETHEIHGNISKSNKVGGVEVWPQRLCPNLNNPTFHQTFTTNRDNTTEPKNTGPWSYLLLLLSDSDVLYFRHKVTQIQMQLKQEKNIFKRNVVVKLSESDSSPLPQNGNGFSGPPCLPGSSSVLSSHAQTFGCSSTLPGGHGCA